MDKQATGSRDAKKERMELRASSRQTVAIRKAAEVSAKTVSAFVLDAAYSDALRVLADSQIFNLDENKWEAFVTALERPVVKKRKLRELMSRSSILEGE